MHRLARQITELPLAMTAQVNTLQPVALGGGHHVETTTGVKAGAMGQCIAA